MASGYFTGPGPLVDHCWVKTYSSRQAVPFFCFCLSLAMLLSLDPVHLVRRTYFWRCISNITFLYHSPTTPHATKLTASSCLFPGPFYTPGYSTSSYLHMRLKFYDLRQSHVLFNYCTMSSTQWQLLNEAMNMPRSLDLPITPQCTLHTERWLQKSRLKAILCYFKSWMLRQQTMPFLWLSLCGSWGADVSYFLSRLRKHLPFWRVQDEERRWG